MNSDLGASGRLAREACAEFPNASSRALARMLRKNHPRVYVSEDTARAAIRYARGERPSHGGATTLRPVARVPLPVIPESFGKKRGEFPVSGPASILVLCDAHIPYHDKRAIEAAVKTGKRRGVTGLYLNGDWADFYRVSRFERDPEARRLPEEIDAVKDSLAYLRDQFPKARIWYRKGNHEHRYDAYLRACAPELLGLDGLGLDKILRLDDFGITSIDEYTPVLFGHYLYGIHGNEYGSGTGSPVNPARGLLLKTKQCSFCGHFHRTSEQPERTLAQKQLAAWSVGCLCDLHPEYASQNQWNHGHAVLELDRAGGFCFLNMRSEGGKVYGDA